MTITLQVLIRFVTVQVTIALGMELEHLVTQASTNLETFLEGLFGLKLIFLDLGLLGADLSHLETKITSLSLHELHARRRSFHYSPSLLGKCEHCPQHGRAHAEDRSHEGLRHKHPLSLHNVEASNGSLEGCRHRLPHHEGTHPSCLKEKILHHFYN